MACRPTRVLLVTAVIWGCSFALIETTIAADTKNSTKAEDAEETFKRRILPILRSRNPSSCTECHLSGVALKDYIRTTQEKTFAALRAAEMIDLKNPEESKILKFIQRAPETPSPVAAKVRQQELDAFRAWILLAVNDKQLLAIEPAEAPAGPSVPAEVVRHARVDRVLESFDANIWSEINRCVNCHSPDRNEKKVRQFGTRMSWIAPNDPKKTLAYLTNSKLINTRVPQRSLLLLKPTNQVKHGGGVKFKVGDPAYQKFAAFILDYSAVVNGKYTKVDQLPNK